MLLEMLAEWEPLAEHIGRARWRARSARVRHERRLRPGRHLRRQGRRRSSGACATPPTEIARLRPEIAQAGGSFAGFADHRVLDPTISDTLTLSTFHGCPPEEIESITKHLIDAHDLDVIVKLNPTLLGYETVAGIVNDELGYRDVSVKEQAFADDLQFDRGDRTDRRTRPVRGRTWPPVRHQADEHARRRQHQGVDARRDDVPVGRRRSTCSPRPCSTGWPTALPGSVRDPRPRRRRHGQLLGRHHQGEPGRLDRDGGQPGDRLLRPAQARRLRTAGADAQGAHVDRARRRAAPTCRRGRRSARPRPRPPATPTSCSRHVAHDPRRRASATTTSRATRSCRARSTTTSRCSAVSRATSA